MNIFIDTETTGFLEPQFRRGLFGNGRLMELAYVCVENRKIIDTYSALISPISVYKVCYAGHGLTWEMCKSEGVDLEIPLGKLGELLKIPGTHIFAYNASFDAKVIRDECVSRKELERFLFIPERFEDFPNSERLTLLQRWKNTFPGSPKIQTHRATEDAIMLAEIANKCRY